MSASIIVLTPPRRCDPGLAIAAVRAGEIGLLDLGCGPPGSVEHRRALGRLARFTDGRDTWGVRWDTLGDPSRDLASLSALHDSPLPYLLVGGAVPDDLDHLLQHARELAGKILLEVPDVATARAAISAGFDGVVVKASEAGGRVGESSSFILLQSLQDSLEGPFWIQGAWGPDTAAAAYLAGATGIVLGEELWLTRESRLDEGERRRLSGMDGSESRCLGTSGANFRLLGGPDELDEMERQIEAGAPWPDILYRRWHEAASGPRPLGQGIAFAARLAEDGVTVAGVLDAFRRRVTNHLKAVREQTPLAAGAPLAAACGTRYPIFQGPMTRVSDTPDFCAAVAKNGALPFLALSLMRGPEVQALLEKTSPRLGKMPWGIGILGFVPPVLRREQLQVVTRHRPHFAVIAGGRPAQARELEEAGISTYLHVPSPGLLRAFLDEGARKFIFEGRECGGHVGPRSSFALWQSAIDVILDADVRDPESIHVLFAGGIHDATSAALVQTLAAGLVKRGVKIGVLIGTAYLFTDEAVQCGAVSPVFQQQAVACDRTALLQSGTGHATRCARTPFVDEFERQRGELLRQKRSSEEVRVQLEMLNVGRLRLASRAQRRQPGGGQTENEVLRAAAAAARPAAAGNARDQLDQVAGTVEKGRLVPVDEETQRRDGMYMIGEVATLRREVLPMAALHEQLSVQGTKTAARLARRTLPWTPRRRATVRRREPVAIVGMSCRFPRSPDLRSYWQNILASFDPIEEVDPERWSPEIYYSADRTAPDRLYSKWGSFLEKKRFDPLRYGIPPASVTSIDPMQLLLLEVSLAALDDAGYARRPFQRQRTAVIMGSGGVGDLGIKYAARTMLPQFLSKVDGLDAATRDRIITSVQDQVPGWTEDSFPGILFNILSGRVANQLDLQGTNFVVDAACAASLAAVSVALEQLRLGQCDTALVGAADGTNTAFGFMSFAKTHALAPSGKVRPFDARADGIVLGEGVAALVLKRLSDAERDGDRIHAVIRGIGSSSDGRNKSLTAPHAAAQALALTRAYEDAGIDPASVSLVEAHATGTTVGDRSEIGALKEVYGDAETSRCAIGSVKSMIGHTKCVAGLAGVLKTALALRHRILPPTANVEEPNAAIGDSPFYINSEPRPWIDDDDSQPRRAGVSAFGFGGTNFHLVMEEYRGDYLEDARIDLTPRPAELFTWCRPDAAGLVGDLEALRKRLQEHPQAGLAQVAFSVHLEERHRPGDSGRVRLGLMATSTADLLTKIDRAIQVAGAGGRCEELAGIYYSDEPAVTPEQVCFLFPGQGSQRLDMLRDLVQYGSFGPGTLEKADRLLADLLPRPLSSYIYPQPAFDDQERRRQRAELDDTRITQPALGVMNVFANDVLGRFGLRPAFVAGHSYGEYVALHVGGTSSREDLLRLSALRGLAVYDVARDNPGGMAAVSAGGEETEAALAKLDLPVHVANLNAPRQTIIAGSLDAIDAAIRGLRTMRLGVRRVAVTAAFHTPAMEEPLKVFAEHLKQVQMIPAAIPVYSNVSAEPYPDDIAAMKSQLAVHLARRVRFVEQIRAMHTAGARIFIEAGPGRILTGLVQRILEGEEHAALALDMPGQPGWLPLGHLLARAWMLGLPVERRVWFEGRGLEPVGSVELARQLQQKAQTRPTDWLISPQGAQPLAATSPVTAASSMIAGHEGDMGHKEDGKGASPEPGPAELTPARQALLDGLQESMRSWLELQRENQRLSQRFLDIQEQLAAALTGTALPPRSSARPPATSDAKEGRPLAAAGLRVAPAPVLPLLQPTAGEGTPVQPGQVVPSISNGAPEVPLDPAGTATRSHAPGPEAGDGGEAEGDAPSVATFQRDLIAEVSRRTGYPEDVLDIDMALEAGLGIDSIKTMEIFSALKKYHAFLADEGQDEEETLVQFTQMKTLRKIIDYYAARRTKVPVAAMTSEAAAGGEETGDVVETGDDEGHGEPAVIEAIAGPSNGVGIIERLVLRPVLAPPEAATDEAVAMQVDGFPADQILLILGEVPELTSALEAALGSTGLQVIQLVAEQPDRPPVPGKYAVDLSDLAAVKKVAAEIRQREGRPVGGILNLLTLTPAMRRPGLNGAAAPLRLVGWLLNVAKAFEDDIRETRQAGGGLLVNVTSMDGRFGLRGVQALPVAQAGSLGFFKSLAREWGVRLKNIDLDPQADPRAQVIGVLRELAAWDDLEEVGIDADGRWRLDLVAEALPAETLSGELAGSFGLEREAVVLVTGGARGITAEVTKRLAEKTGATLVIVGRTPLSRKDEEPEAVRGLVYEADLRQALVNCRRQADKPIVPAEVEDELRGILGRRVMRANLAAMRAAGATVEYHALDVRRTKKLAALIDDVYSRLGRIDGVIHGAGVVEDGWLKNKEAESFARVFETKVNSALVLARKLKPEGLRFMVLFSSLSGRLGNRGQIDYSAANECLNKLAGHLDREWPGRVVAINWGPWDGGLMSPGLRAAYRERGIQLIPTEAGADSLLHELVCDRSRETEVVLTCSSRELIAGG